MSTDLIWNRQSSRTNCVFRIQGEVGAVFEIHFRPAYLN